MMVATKRDSTGLVSLIPVIISSSTVDYFRLVEDEAEQPEKYYLPYSRNPTISDFVTKGRSQRTSQPVSTVLQDIYDDASFGQEETFEEMLDRTRGAWADLLEVEDLIADARKKWMQAWRSSQSTS